MTLLWASGSAAAKLGSWTLDGQGSDSPWLPAAALPEIEVGSAALTVQFAGQDAIGAWSARAATAVDVLGQTPSDLGGRDTDVPPAASVALAPLMPGRWVISVRLDRADGRGDATGYWLVRVD